jgi:hypothetical protein
MKCPHCLNGFHEGQTEATFQIGNDDDGEWLIRRYQCSSCHKLIFFLEGGTIANKDAKGICRLSQAHISTTTMIRPRGSLRPLCPPQVPKDIADDYNEACLVLPDSPKASAALSRRALQHLLRETVKVKHQDLAREIQEVLDSKQLPSYIAEMIDAVRNIGNFSAHPLKSKSTGEILPVEPGEAEWNLDVLEALFDFYYVQPDKAKQKKDALNKKLADAGKPPMK